LQVARDEAIEILETDPLMEKSENRAIRRHIDSLNKNAVNWSRVS
jgi:ATP-dependent DNA helicase RecG